MYVCVLGIYLVLSSHVMVNPAHHNSFQISDTAASIPVPLNWNWHGKAITLQ